MAEEKKKHPFNIDKVCNSNFVKKYFLHALNYLLDVAQSSGLTDFRNLRDLEEKKIDILLKRRPDTFYESDYTESVTAFSKALQERKYRMSPSRKTFTRIKTGNDEKKWAIAYVNPLRYEWHRYANSDMFIRWENFVTSQLRLVKDCYSAIIVEVKERDILVTRAYQKLDPEKMNIYTVGIEEHLGKSETGKFGRSKIGEHVLGKLKECSISILKVSFMENDIGHAVYVVMEREKGKLNLYLYDPNGEHHPILIRLMEMIGKKATDQNIVSSYRVVMKSLCPIGLQLYSEEQIGYCDTFALISVTMVIKMLTEMIKNGEYKPIRFWGPCMEHWLAKLYTPKQLLLLFLGVSQVISAVAARVKNLTLEKVLTGIEKEKYGKMGRERHVLDFLLPRAIERKDWDRARKLVEELELTRDEVMSILPSDLSRKEKNELYSEIYPHLEPVLKRYGKASTLRKRKSKE